MAINRIQRTNRKMDADKKRVGDNAGQTASSDREIAVEGDRGVKSGRYNILYDPSCFQGYTRTVLGDFGIPTEVPGRALTGSMNQAQDHK